MFFRVIKILALFLFSIIAIFPLTYFFGFFYKLIVGNYVSGSFWGLDGSISAGFLMSFVCLLSFYILFIFKKNIIKIILMSLLIFFIFFSFYNFLLIDIILLISASLLGFLLGFISKIFYNQLSVNK